MTAPQPHQFLMRRDGSAVTEVFAGDRSVKWLYSSVRESAPALYRWLTHSRQFNQWLANINFDLPLVSASSSIHDFCEKSDIDLSDAVGMPIAGSAASWRDVFGRKIEFWRSRPMSNNQFEVVCPSDSRVLLSPTCNGATVNDCSNRIEVKNKLFSNQELVGKEKAWASNFAQAQWAIFRLTPEKYHFNHVPVSGVVLDVYSLDGAYHSCNPLVASHEIRPTSRNARLITIVDTEVAWGSQVGIVAIVEVVALLIGRIEQCYSAHCYESPQALEPGMHVYRGNVKSRFDPGSSTVVLLFEPNRIQFSADLVANQARIDIPSRFTKVYGTPMVETDVRVRSALGYAKPLVKGEIT